MELGIITESKTCLKNNKRKPIRVTAFSFAGKYVSQSLLSSHWEPTGVLIQFKCARYSRDGLTLSVRIGNSMSEKHFNSVSEKHEENNSCDDENFMMKNSMIFWLLMKNSMIFPNILGCIFFYLLPLFHNSRVLFNNFSILSLWSIDSATILGYRTVRIKYKELIIQNNHILKPFTVHQIQFLSLIDSMRA